MWCSESLSNLACCNAGATSRMRVTATDDYGSPLHPAFMSEIFNY